MEIQLLQTLHSIISDLADALVYVPQGFILGIIMVTMIMVWCGFRRRPYPPGYKLTVIFLVGIYAAVYMNLTFLSREPGSRIGRDWQLFATWGTHWIPDTYFIENILLLIPLGFLLPIGVQKFQKLRFCAGVGALVSIVTESIQLITQRGHCQVDDVMTNILGMAVGWMMYRWVRKRYLMVSSLETAKIFIIHGRS